MKKAHYLYFIISMLVSCHAVIAAPIKFFTFVVTNEDWVCSDPKEASACAGKVPRGLMFVGPEFGDWAYGAYLRGFLKRQSLGKVLSTGVDSYSIPLAVSYQGVHYPRFNLNSSNRGPYNLQILRTGKGLEIVCTIPSGKYYEDWHMEAAMDLNADGSDDFLFSTGYNTGPYFDMHAFVSNHGSYEHTLLLDTFEGKDSGMLSLKWPERVIIANARYSSREQGLVVSYTKSLTVDGQPAYSNGLSLIKYNAPERQWQLEYGHH